MHGRGKEYNSTERIYELKYLIAAMPLPNFLPKLRPINKLDGLNNRILNILHHHCCANIKITNLIQSSQNVGPLSVYSIK